MKLEDLLMQQACEQKQMHKRNQLQEEVEKLEEELEGELKVNRVLQCALQGPLSSCASLSSPLLPPKVQVLLTELSMVEEEINTLERKIEGLKLSLYREQRKNKNRELQQRPHPGRHSHEKHLLSGKGNRKELKDLEQISNSLINEENRKNKVVKERRASLGSVLDFQNMFTTSSNDEMAESSRYPRRSSTPTHEDIEIVIENANKLSEEMLKCLIGLYLKMNQVVAEGKGSAIPPKHTLPWMNSKGCISKTTFNCKTPVVFWVDNKISSLDPYGIQPDFDVNIRDVGPYKNYIQITRNSMDTSRVPDFLPAMGKLRVLMHKLRKVDSTLLTNKQKLAFWINIYNACIMHAFLQHGLPSNQEKLLVVMNKAEVNVSGIVLNALAIEHFILRHPSDAKHDPTDEKEMLLRHIYGLGYPEPNVTFALCRGSWSSPALRVYTPDEVVNELERAKVEYLEASIGVTSKRKVVVPKLLQWHMKDFADDMASLLEWIYSQLPHSSSAKRLIMECLNGEPKSRSEKMVETQPYDSEFRYLLPLYG